MAEMYKIIDPHQRGPISWDSFLELMAYLEKCRYEANTNFRIEEREDEMAHYAQILVKRKQKALEQEKKDDVLREQREKDKLTRELSLHEDNQCRTIRNGELVGTDEKSMRRKSVNSFLGSGAIKSAPDRERVIDQFPSKSKESTVDVESDGEYSDEFDDDEDDKYSEEDFEEEDSPTPLAVE